MEKILPFHDTMLLILRQVSAVCFIFFSAVISHAQPPDPPHPNGNGQVASNASTLSNGQGSSGPLLSYSNSVFVSGNFAYVAAKFNNALEIVDISNPATHCTKAVLVME